ncbi:hypothetical protein DFP72DRAFT_39447 [Ephemerocybe angulata]|uniref:Uncharacterized protein n=1 Tax=Ephemerocybe angulata TaxID=980116 RepID=A0A8H6I9G9_9AGAR|nr:hypothetical protein DFP72DRAFT_39447 [Tulosesus angulatus]
MPAKAVVDDCVPFDVQDWNRRVLMTRPTLSKTREHRWRRALTHHATPIQATDTRTLGPRIDDDGSKCQPKCPCRAYATLLEMSNRNSRRYVLHKGDVSKLSTSTPATTRIPRAQRTRRRPRPVVYLSTDGESRRIANSDERATSTTAGEDGSGKIGKWSETSMVERYGVGCASCIMHQPRWFEASSMALRR